MTTTKPSAETLEIHVFGANIGETIVLRLGKDQFGIVDCYARSRTDSRTNPAISLLKSFNAKDVKFVALTHPHMDHIRGMCQIFREFSVAEFWLPAAMTGEHLRWLIRQSMLNGGTPVPTESSELESIFHEIAQKREQGEATPERKRGLLGTPMYFDGDRELNIQCWSPCNAEISKYEDQLTQCFAPTGTLIEKRPRTLEHNRISLVLHITFGRTSILLGGDAEEENWSAIAKQASFRCDSVDFAKISHHGSTNGYCDDLWEAISKGGPPVCALTPYSSKNLPDIEALKHISRFSKSIWTPYVSKSLVKGTTQGGLFQHVVLKKFAAEPMDIGETGHLKFVFDQCGTCLEAVDIGGFGGDLAIHDREFN